MQSQALALISISKWSEMLLRGWLQVLLFEDSCCSRAISSEKVTGDRQVEKLRRAGLGVSRKVALKSPPFMKDEDL